MERDSTEDWMLPEDRPSEVDRVLRALEDGISEVGRIALSALEQSGKAAELAERAAERAEKAAASASQEPASAQPAQQPHQRANSSDEDDLMRRFTEHADRVTRRLQALERRPGMVQGTAPDPQEQWP